MDLYYETSGNISTATPVGQWNVRGFREVAVHMWFKGAGGAKVYPELYFNGLSAAQETVTIGPAGPGGWNIAIVTKVYPVFAPTLAIVLYNPSVPMDFQLRLCAACCDGGKTPRSKAARTIAKKLDMAKLVRGPQPAGGR